MRPVDADIIDAQIRAWIGQPGYGDYWTGYDNALCAIQDFIADIPTLTPPNEPLTIEQLREMDGEPVWVEFEDGSGGLWGIVHITIFAQIVFANGLHCTIGERYYGKSYKAYRRPPEGEV